MVYPVTLVPHIYRCHLCLISGNTEKECNDLTLRRDNLQNFSKRVYTLVIHHFTEGGVSISGSF